MWTKLHFSFFSYRTIEYGRSRSTASYSSAYSTWREHWWWRSLAVAFEVTVDGSNRGRKSLAGSHERVVVHPKPQGRLEGDNGFLATVFRASRSSNPMLLPARRSWSSTRAEEDRGRGSSSPRRTATGCCYCRSSPSMRLWWSPLVGYL